MQSCFASSLCFVIWSFWTHWWSQNGDSIDDVLERVNLTSESKNLEEVMPTSKSVKTTNKEKARR